MTTRRKTPASAAAASVLTADIGNTNIVIGLVSDGRCMARWRLASDARRSADEYAVLLNGLFATGSTPRPRADGAVIGSVVPALTTTLSTAIQAVFGIAPLCLTHKHKFPVKNKYERPHEVGMDRLANATAGVLLYGAPVIIVDLGTACTLDVVNKRREYLGGTILPGIELAIESLAKGTALLSSVSAAEPESVIGRTTAASIKSGVINGMAGAVDHLIRAIHKETGEKGRVVATGGLAHLLVGRSAFVKELNSDLTLLGLAQIWQANQS